MKTCFDGNHSRFTVLVASSLLFLAGCTAMQQMSRKECTRYGSQEVVQTYCAQMAPQTCSTDSSGNYSCFGGGYCVKMGSRLVTVNSCIDFVCKSGYARHSDDNCYTPEELAELPAKPNLYMMPQFLNRQDALNFASEDCAKRHCGAQRSDCWSLRSVEIAGSSTLPVSARPVGMSYNYECVTWKEYDKWLRSDEYTTWKYHGPQAPY